ncbi:uncharacterized protein LOC110457136 [Mizuhopecten yessoensis]|uniref:Apple domain-containing protein n=1 Tax=Mizuhopecten yessoensis TaxID=6573 RepID=A0A210Q9G7_MIZYE|nr:uncharacterized protein LOC110457136 [Mizuhopecten yessoensis]OWF45376.1 hypothetical protein KP79_PYT08066 [Mizuhopecten yessoensis]
MKVLVLICFCGMMRHVTSQCFPTPNVTPGPNDPQLPTLPSEFQTRVEANIQDKGFTVTAEEYFSTLDKRATVKLIRDGDITTLLFDYANNQLFYVKDNKCQIGNLSSDINTMLFGDDMIKGIPHIVTTNAALHFLKSSGQVYKGQAMVRGITTDHWQTCLQWPKLNSTFVLDYYFTASTWSDPVAFPQIPVRAVTAGIQTLSTGQAVQFNHTYEYFDFRPEIMEDDVIFETPPGVICFGRVSTKPIPQLSTKYHYRSEIITSVQDSIVSTDVWYDDDYKLVRYDYKNLSPIPPTYTLNPLSEVHDFNTGLRYIRDQVTGNCTILPIGNTSFDSFEAQGSFSANNSYVVHMKNPMQLFYLDNSYTYVGMRKARGVVCNVFSTFRTDYLYAGQKTNATFEYYFLSDVYTEHPDDGDTDPHDIPYMLLVNVVSFGEALPDFTITYNFLDFDKGHPDMSVFDVTACYSNQASLQFKVRFPGAYKPYTDLQIRQGAHNIFALNANVSNIRIQNVQLENDNSNVYVSATMLDRSPPSSQFTLVAQKSIERHGDQTYGYVANVKDCARYCINNVNFVCNSYEWCSGDTDNNCRLSKRHIGDGSVLHESTCDHYSRTVTGPMVQEIDVFRAYNNLRQAVYNNMLQIPAYEADLTTTYYNAVEIEIIFGWLSSDPFPAVDSQFSYLLEIVVPDVQMAYEARIWYDYNYKLVRYDMATSPPGGKFKTGNPMSYINDFNTGLAYTIDRTFGNCSITPVASSTFDSNPNRKDALKNGAYVVQMKNPLDFFDVNNVYKYSGQKTIRGILCIIFETITDEFKLQGVSTKFTSRLQFFFAYDTWKTTPSGSNIPVQSQPIRMDVSSEEIGLFLTYNFFDFNLQDPDLTNFDITPCFGGTEKREFLIRFPGSYHPVLDANVKVFLKKAQTLLAQASMASPIRFQRTEVTYDANYVKLIGTVVNIAPFIVDFTKTSSKANPHKTDATYSNVMSDKDCATYCRVESNFPCESFDYCSASSTCLLSKEHVDDGPALSSSSTCDHYSRTVNSTDAVQPSIDAIMVKLNDVIYKGLFQIPILEGGNTTIFIADQIRDNLVRASRYPTSSQVLSHFNLTENNILIVKNSGYVAGISVDECADACLTEMSFDCLSFDFCYKQGDCLLYKAHPDAQNTTLTHHDFCDVYSRNYLDRYTSSPGMVVSVTADKELDKVNSDNLCAKQCSEYSGFPCKSFEYCSNTKTCRLMKKHQLDFPASSLVTSPTCSFYTRNYIDDFQKKSRSTMTFGKTLDYTDVTADDCAKLCVTTEATNCQSFAFCNTTQLCRLTSNRPLKKGGKVTHDVCDLYIRKYFSTGHSQASTGNAQTAGNKSSNTGYSAGAMAGVGIGLFLPGLLIGALVTFYFRRKHDQSLEALDMQQIVKD